MTNCALFRGRRHHEDLAQLLQLLAQGSQPRGVDTVVVREQDTHR